MTENNVDLKKVIADAAAAYSADLFIYSGSIDDKGYGRIAEAVTEAQSKEKDRKPNALLILTTNGGNANAAFQIARIFQNTYQRFYLYTPAYCKSAGTIIALGAHHLIMDIFSELGPLDVQLYKENEIFGRKSGLLARAAFESLNQSTFDLFEHFLLKITISSQGLVGFKTASEISAQITSGVMAGVYSQINPDVVGSDYRNLEVAFEYGRRLAELSENASIATVFNLVHGYPSHDFIIDNDEATKLFENVDVPLEELYAVVRLFTSALYDEAKSTIVLYLDPDKLELPKDAETRKGEENEASDKTRGEKEVAPSRKGNRGGNSEPRAAGRSSPSDADTTQTKDADATKRSRKADEKPAPK